MGQLLRTWRRTGTRLKCHAELHATTITLVLALVIVLIDTGRRRDSNPLSLRWQNLPLQASELNVIRDLCDVLIARPGNWCFRDHRCHRSTSKDQQGWILQLSLPESKLDWKLPEDVLSWALGIVRAFDPNGIQSRELCVCPSAKTLCVLPPSPRIGLIDKSPTLRPEPSTVLADVVAIAVKGRRACELQHDHGRTEHHEASLPLVIRHRSGHFAPKEFTRRSKHKPRQSKFCASCEWHVARIRQSQRRAHTRELQRASLRKAGPRLALGRPKEHHTSACRRLGSNRRPPRETWAGIQRPTSGRVHQTIWGKTSRYPCLGPIALELYRLLALLLVWWLTQLPTPQQPQSSNQRPFAVYLQQHECHFPQVPPGRVAPEWRFHHQFSNP